MIDAIIRPLPTTPVSSFILSFVGNMLAGDPPCEAFTDALTQYAVTASRAPHEPPIMHSS